MNWIGKWKNQYGSILEITSVDGDKLEGKFISAVDQSTKGMPLQLFGVVKDNLIAVSCAGGDHVVTYAGMFYKGKLETVWQVVTDQIITAESEGELAQKKSLDWWQSVKTNADTFERTEN